MPIYAYRNEAGDEVERFFHTADAAPKYIKVDGVTFNRAEITRFAVPCTPEPVQGDAMLRGYYDQECAHGSRFRSRFSAETIKRAWKDDRETPADRGEVVNVGG